MLGHPDMLTHTTLSHEQICALLADIAGTKPDAVVVTPLTGDETSAVQAVIATDIKGANRLDRALAKAGAVS